MRRARQTVGRRGKVVASIYVNPTQFGPDEDLGRYPRDLPGDKRLCAEAGVDVLFVPADGDMYPAGFRHVCGGGKTVAPDGRGGASGAFPRVTTTW